MLILSSCSKLDVDTPDKFSDDNFWTSENNVRSYTWGFYDLFTGYGTGTTADFYFSSFSDDQASPTFQNFTLNPPTTSGDWSWTYIRKANIMLERIDKVPMPEEAKNHWRGVARFFRAMDYFNKVKVFGDVPYISKSLDISENDVIYKPRDKRTLVMDSVLADLNFAVANIRATDQDNTVNKDVALALKSRICLFEGSYRVYHTELNLPDAEKFLKEGKAASEALINGKYSLGNYKALYNSMELNTNKEVLLYKRYVAGVLTHSVIGYTNSTTQMNGLTKSAVESYLAKDGLPISQSPLYKGDNTIRDVAANRDLRLGQTIDTTKLAYNGALASGLSSSTGYLITKFLQPASVQLAPQNETDAPIFYLSEVLLNYAECAALLDKLGSSAFTQSDLDKSINPLRTRAGVATLTLTGGGNVSASGVQVNDPKRPAAISPLMWEIRRERRVELMMNGFRFSDLMRWKEGENMDTSKNPDAFLGAKVPANPTVRRNAAGYIQVYAANLTRTFVDPKNYLSPIPTGQFSLYPEGTLTQNPGW